MERREFLRQAAAGAAGLMLTEPEKEVVDSRLTQKAGARSAGPVPGCAFKGIALSDLCERLRGDTGVHLPAGPSVADEKVTLFCQKIPLRDVMRQLSRSFGYTWLRTGAAGQYGYELMQDLRSQLLEEELRNRDRNAALLALEQEIERYRPFLDLSPDEALARSETASPAEKQILENLGGKSWGPAQMYFKLSRADLEALRAGQKLRFDSAPHTGEQPLPAGYPRSGWMTHGVLQTGRDLRFYKRGGLFHLTGAADAEAKVPDALPPASTPEAGAGLSLQFVQSELGQFELVGEDRYYAGTQPGHRDVATTTATHLALGRSPAALKPENGTANARLARDPALRAPVIVQPKPDLTPSPFPAREGVSPRPASDPSGEGHRPPLLPGEGLGEGLDSSPGLPAPTSWRRSTRRPVCRSSRTTTRTSTSRKRSRSRENRSSMR